jgi:hypothetical protein
VEGDDVEQMQILSISTSELGVTQDNFWNILVSLNNSSMSEGRSLISYKREWLKFSLNER